MPQITEQQMAFQVSNATFGLEGASKRNMRALASEWRVKF